MVNEIFDIIRAVSESGTTVLLVEQNAKKALSIADRAYVLEKGRRSSFREMQKNFWKMIRLKRLISESKGGVF